MSYQQRVLRDNPIGFWALDKANFAIDNSTGIFVDGTRTLNSAVIGSSAVTAGINPLVCGGTSSVALIDDADSYVRLANNYNVFLKGSERKTFSIEFWMSQESTNSVTNTSILNVENTINLSLVDNIMTLSVTDSVNSSVKYGYVEVEDLDPQIYVNVIYSDKSFTLTINGNSSTTIQLDSKFKFNETSAPMINFSTYNSLPSGAGSKIIIDSIAFYNYALSMDQLQNHMIWALSDKNAMAWTTSNGGGYISPKDEHGRNENYFMFINDSDWKKGEFRNCYSDLGVLSVPYISQLIKYNLTQAQSISLHSSNGLQVSNDSSMLWEDFGSTFIPATDSIKLTAKATSPSSVISITGFNFGQLILRANSLGNIELYCPEDENIIITTTTSFSSWKDIVIYFNNNKVYIKVGSSDALSATLQNQISYSKINLYLGNSYVVNSSGGTETSALVGGLKNIYIYKNDNTASNADSAYIYIPLTSDYNISQKSYWYAQVLPISGSDIILSRIDYGSSSKNVKVYTSTDKENWNQVENKKRIPDILTYSPQSIFYVKIEIDTPNSSINRPNVNYLELITYSSLYIDSRGFHFSLVPYSGQFSLRTSDFNVLSRDNNLGIIFEEMTNPCVAKLTPSADFYAIEFWFKVNTENPYGSSKIIMSMPDGGIGDLMYGGENLLIDASANVFSSAYLNGELINPTSPPSLIVNEPYHFIGVLTTPNQSNIYLNGDDSSGKNGNISIGNICLYGDNPFTSSDIALTQYKRHIGIADNSISDSTPIIINSITDSAKVFAAQWSVVKAAMV